MVGNWRYLKHSDSTNMRHRPSTLVNFPLVGETVATSAQDQPQVTRYSFHASGTRAEASSTTTHAKSSCPPGPSNKTLPVSSPSMPSTVHATSVTPPPPNLPPSSPSSRLLSTPSLKSPSWPSQLSKSPSSPPPCPPPAFQTQPIRNDQISSLAPDAVMFQVAVARTPTIQPPTSIVPTQGATELPTSMASNPATQGSEEDAERMHAHMISHSTAEPLLVPTKAVQTPVVSPVMTPVVSEMTSPPHVSAGPLAAKHTLKPTVANSGFSMKATKFETAEELVDSERPQHMQQAPPVPVVSVEDSNSEIAARMSALSLRPLQAISNIRRASSDTCLMRRGETELKGMNLVSPLSRTPMIALSHRAGTEIEYNVEASFDFARQAVDAVNNAAICLLIALGHRLGLFTVLRRLAPSPQPAAVIATAANLCIRPVEEWLGAMTCAGIVEMRAQDDTTTGVTMTSFVLPIEHALWLTWGYGTNLALLCESIPSLGRVEHTIAKCYRRGGGVDRSAYSDYERVLAYDVMQTVGVRILSILRVVPNLVDELSRGICVICIGGAADAVYIRLARMFPRSWFTCYGTDARRTASARKSTDETGVTNVHFKTITRLDNIHERESYEAAFVLEGSAVRESDYPVRCLIALRRALYHDRPLLYVEMMATGDVQSDRTHSVATYLFSIAALYNLPKALAQGGQGSTASGIWGHVSVRNSMYDAGFTDVQTSALEDDSLNCILVARAEKTGSEYSSSTH